jgi:hypothetical protein
VQPLFVDSPSVVHQHGAAKSPVRLRHNRISTHDAARPKLLQKRRNGDDSDPIGLKTSDQIIIEEVAVERDDVLGATTTSRLEEHVIVRIAAPLRAALQLDNLRGTCEEDTKLKDIFDRQTVQRTHEHFDVFMQDLPARHELDVPT